MPMTSAPAARWLPAPTPIGSLPQPRRLPGWAAYAAFVACYLAVFGPWWSLLWPAPPVPTTSAWDLWWPWTLHQWSIHAATSLTVLVLAAVVTRRLGLRLSDIGIRPAWTRDPAHRVHHRRQARSVFALVLAAYGAATVLKTVIATQAGSGAMDEAHPVAMALATTPLALTTSWIEETLTLALLVLLLRAARQHPAAILVAAAAAKIPYHLYMGPGALAVILPAVVCVWAYRRTGRLTPIIAAHAAHNLVLNALVLSAAAPGQG